MAAVKVEKYPLYAVVAVDAQQALAAYGHTRDKIVIWTLAVGFAALCAGGVVFTLARRLDAGRRRVKRAEATLRATLEGSLDAVTVLTAVRDEYGRLVDMKVTDCNTLAASMLGLQRTDLMDRHLIEVAPSMAAFLNHFDGAIRTQRGSQAEVAATEPSLHGKWLHHQLVPVQDGVALITRDVTDRRMAAESLASLAHTDVLTGLSNRRHFDEVLASARARSVRSGEAFALMYIDLDSFKAVNDGLGHAAGDAVLIGVADRLKGQVRETDFVGRLGGDEFALVAERSGSLLDIEALCERVVRSLQAVHLIAGEEVLATPSIGLAIFDGQGSTDVLCARADGAMYSAKAKGRSRFVIADAACHSPQLLTG